MGKVKLNLGTIVFTVVVTVICYRAIGAASQQVFHTTSSDYVPNEKNFDEEARAIKVYYGPELSTSKIRHMLIYIDGLCKYYNIDYALVKAVISVESGWDRKAKSNANCLGLMQISKAAAVDYKTPHSLMYDPYINITIGIKHLARLKARLPDENTARLLVAYNVGLEHAKVMSSVKVGWHKYVKRVMARIET
tara:strand:- start:41 stop:619 length:579 start_codon:yes stop_codon:yes gene_type:complete